MNPITHPTTGVPLCYCGATGNAYLVQGTATALPMADQSVDLTFCSPPYLDARTYGINAHRGCEDWIEWMLLVVREAARVTRGLVLINCAGVTRKHRYWPGPEGLLYRWWEAGGECWRPAYWHRVGIPGSGGKQWLRADVEYVLAFKANPGAIPWAENTVNGHPPKYAPGGAMSYRQIDGQRVNLKNRDQWGGTSSSGGSRRADGVLKNRIRKPMYRRGRDGERQNATLKKVNRCNRSGGGNRAIAGDEVEAYVPPVLANPGCLVKGIKVGGGIMGSPLAHENEAPFPEALAEWFIKGWCPPGGTVLDPFSGSGTTVSVARRLGRIGIGVDLRMSQCDLARRRLAEPPRGESKPRRPTPPVSVQPLLFLNAMGGAA